MTRFELPDLPLWMWLAMAAIPALFLAIGMGVWVWVIRWADRRETERQNRIAHSLAQGGWRLSAEDKDCDRIEAALKDLRSGGSFDIHWVAAGNLGALFEYWTGADLAKHGYGYLERSSCGTLTGAVWISPRARWMGMDAGPVFDGGREVGEGWTHPEFHKRYRVVARDAAEGSRVVTSRLQLLLLELPDVSQTANDKELVEVAINARHWTVLGRKSDWGVIKLEKQFPDIENHLRLAGRIRDALGR